MFRWLLASLLCSSCLAVAQTGAAAGRPGCAQTVTVFNASNYERAERIAQAMHLRLQYVYRNDAGEAGFAAVTSPAQRSALAQLGDVDYVSAKRGWLVLTYRDDSHDQADLSLVVQAKLLLPPVTIYHQHLQAIALRPSARQFNRLVHTRLFSHYLPATSLWRVDLATSAGQADINQLAAFGGFKVVTSWLALGQSGFTAWLNPAQLAQLDNQPDVRRLAPELNPATAVPELQPGLPKPVQDCQP